MNTSCHLAEFLLIEPEIPLYDLKDNMDFANGFLKSLTRHALANYADDLHFNNPFYGGGYSWGTATFAPSATVTIPAADQASVTVTTTNNLTRDRGSLEISKTLANEDQATVPASFTVNYDCGLGYTGHVSVSPGSPATVGGIPTGSTCTETEVARVVGPWWGWGTIAYSPAAQVTTAKGATYGIAVGNSITRDRGSLVIAKTLAAGGSGYSTPFAIDYSCALAGAKTLTGTVTVAAGSSKPVSGIPTGYVCTVTETLPGAPSGYTWSTPVISGSPATNSTRQVVQRARPPQACNWSMPASSSSARTRRFPWGTANVPTPSTVSSGMQPHNRKTKAWTAEATSASTDTTRQTTAASM